MTSPEITRLLATTNAAVVQLPERKHPGVVIQGDSLRNLLNLVRAARDEMAKGDTGESQGILAEVGEILGGYLESYKQATEAVKTT